IAQPRWGACRWYKLGSAVGAASLSVIHCLHGALGFLTRRISLAVPHNHRRLSGRLLFDDRAAFGCAVLHDVELRCQRRSGKRRKCCGSNKQFHPHEFLLHCLAEQTSFQPNWFHVIADWFLQVRDSKNRVPASSASPPIMIRERLAGPTTNV